MAKTHFGQHGEECFACKIQTVGLAPSATPSRKNTNPPRVSEGANAWERGTVKDERGMPLLGPNGPVSVKEYANNRGRYDEARQKLAHEAAANTIR